jgi:hypothetical protein
MAPIAMISCIFGARSAFLVLDCFKTRGFWLAWRSERSESPMIESARYLENPQTNPKVRMNDHSHSGIMMLITLTCIQLSPTFRDTIIVTSSWYFNQAKKIHSRIKMLWIFSSLQNLPRNNYWVKSNISCAQSYQWSIIPPETFNSRWIDRRHVSLSRKHKWNPRRATNSQE